MMALTLLLRLDFRPGGNHHHKKGMNAPSALGGECPDHLSGHPLCMEEARLTPEKLDGLNLVGIAPTLASFVGSERTKDVNTLQKSIVNYGWEDYFANLRHFTLGIEFSSSSYLKVKEESSSDRQMQPNEGTTSTRVSKKMRRNKRSHLLDALRAWMGPQAPSVERQSCMLEILSARLGPPATTPMLERPSQLSR
ncbi:hypothetical protein AAG906_035575 [Vitis piasezkii]